ncbi:MAG: hypothetical protein IT336_02790 [Thermomicrobiales bacterium]|nr:hypothetical protein [Thermomicrobiales bacterium]
MEQNAEVNGVPAYHDLTPIYDLVYWESNGVVYSVESQGLTDESSLTLASALHVLTAPGEAELPGEHDGTHELPDRVLAGDVATIGIYGIEGADLVADSGYFEETGESVYAGVGGFDVAWRAPDPGEDAWIGFSVVDTDSGMTVAMGSTLVIAAQAAPEPLALACPDSASAGSVNEIVLSGTGDAIIDAGDGTFPAESPNIEFAPGADGSRTLVGTVPDSGVVALTWIAPATSEQATIYLFATNMQGETTGECAIEVLPLATSDESENSEVVAAGSEPDADKDEDGDQESEDKASNENADDVETPSAEIVNEVRGIPTSEVPDNADDASPTSPSPTPNLTPTVRPTATIAPTQSEDGMAATIFGPDGGTLRSVKGATVVIPPGALGEQATLSIQPVADTKFQTQEGLELVPGSGFDVTIAGPNGVALESELSPPAELRIEIEDIPDGARIYRLNGNVLVAAANTRIEGNELVISVDRFSRFVVGFPVEVQGGRTRSLMPFILAALVVVLVMIAIVVVGGMFRPRRHRVVMSSRPPRQRSRYR